MDKIPMERKSPAHEALMQYRQADQDGIMVLVSRQAIHEVSDEIDKLKNMLALSRLNGAWDEHPDCADVDKLLGK